MVQSLIEAKSVSVDYSYFNPPPVSPTHSMSLPANECTMLQLDRHNDSGNTTSRIHIISKTSTESTLVMGQYQFFFKIDAYIDILTHIADIDSIGDIFLCLVGVPPDVHFP